MKLLILGDGNNSDDLFISENGGYYEDYFELLEATKDKTVELTEYKYVYYYDLLNNGKYLNIFDTLFYGLFTNEEEFRKYFNSLYDFVE